MNLFSTQYSLLSAKALAPFIAEKYQLQNVSCKLLLQGVSDTYKINSDSGSFIFKIYRKAHRTLGEIQGEVELLNILKDNDAKIAYPIKDVHGDFIQHLNAAEGVRNGVLFLYAKGESIYNMSDEQIRIVGIEIAHIHNTTEKLKLQNPRLDFSIENTITKPLELLKPAFEGYEEGYDYLVETSVKVLEALRQIDMSSFSYGFIQYDYLPKNYHFDSDNNVTFFDFDFAGEGYLVNDLMTFLMHYFFYMSEKRIDIEEADRCFTVFLEGYKERRNISNEELAVIPYLGFGFWIFYLNFQYQSFEEWSNHFFNMHHLKRWINWVKLWMETYTDL